MRLAIVPAEGKGKMEVTPKYLLPSSLARLRLNLT